MARIIREQSRTADGYFVRIEHENYYADGQSFFETVFVNDRDMRNSTVGQVLDRLRAAESDVPNLEGESVPDTPQDSGFDLQEVWQSWWESKTTYDELVARNPSPPPPIQARINQYEGIMDGRWTRYWGQLQRYLAANP